MQRFGNDLSYIYNKNRPNWLNIRRNMVMLQKDQLDTLFCQYN